MVELAGAKGPFRTRLRTGAALTPQAGVALGMARVAADAFPEAPDVIIPVSVATTVAFELGGPALTALAPPPGPRGRARRRRGAAARPLTCRRVTVCGADRIRRRSAGGPVRAGTE